MSAHTELSVRLVGVKRWSQMCKCAKNGPRHAVRFALRPPFVRDRMCGRQRFSSGTVREAFRRGSEIQLKCWLLTRRKRHATSLGDLRVGHFMLKGNTSLAPCEVCRADSVPRAANGNKRRLCPCRGPVPAAPFRYGRTSSKYFLFALGTLKGAQTRRRV